MSLGELFNVFKQKAKPVVDRSLVIEPSGGLSGDLVGVLNTMLDRENIFQLSNIKSSQVFYIALLNTIAAKPDNLHSFVSLFIDDLLNLNVSVKGFRSEQLKSIAMGFLGAQLELAKAEARGKGELKEVV